MNMRLIGLSLLVSLIALPVLNGQERPAPGQSEPSREAAAARAAVRHATIEAIVADTSGKPMNGQRLLLSGQSAGASYETFADSDATGTIRMMAPRGTQQISLSLLNPDRELIARFGPTGKAHLRLDGRLEISELYEDRKGLQVTRYTCPKLVVQAVDKAGKAIERFKPVLTYWTTPANAVGSIHGQRGDVYFARQPDGQWRSEQLIPNKEFTLAVTAPGYQASFEKLSLREGEVKELTVELSEIAKDGPRNRPRETSQKGLRNRIFTNSIGMSFVLVPAGEFVMGSPEDEEGRRGPIGDVKTVEEKQHTVRITRPFFVSNYEVTQEQYELVMGENPSQYSAQGTHRERVKGLDTRRFPVESVRWFEANEFCKRLSAMEGETYRLPTEAEWEFACRAGTTTMFHFGNTVDLTEAHLNDTYPEGTEAVGSSPGRPVIVGSYPANPFGLYDMHGNVWEWCSDLSANGYYAMSPRDDPQGPPMTAFNPHFVKEETYNRSIRGGAFYLDPLHCRSARRDGWAPDFPRNHITRAVGIRVVCEVPKESEDSTP